jgi:hypothetical protein
MEEMSAWVGWADDLAGRALLTEIHVKVEENLLTEAFVESHPFGCAQGRL